LQTGAQKTGFSPRDVEAVTEYFEEALLRELAGAYPLKEQPQPGVLHLRIAITELVPTGPRQSKVGRFQSDDVAGERPQGPQHRSKT